jgi:hypothetical protein
MVGGGNHFGVGKSFFPPLFWRETLVFKYQTCGGDEFRILQGRMNLDRASLRTS